MTFFGMALLTAAGTIVLAAFVIVTAWYARRAFLGGTPESLGQAGSQALGRRPLPDRLPRGCRHLSDVPGLRVPAGHHLVVLTT
jgi:hypothetical protein